MKKYLKILILSFIPVVMFNLMTSCSDKDEFGDGEPKVHYVRVTNPEKSDSLLVSAYMGNLVAIIGENLGKTTELWFNDKKAVLNPNYVTNKSIIVNVPNSVPINITDEIKFVLKDGKEYKYNFVVSVPAPIIDKLNNEYAQVGEEAIISGNYFYAPLEVVFQGGAKGTVVSVKETEVKVIIPEGAQRGPIEVRTNFGKATTKAHLYDNRNIFASLDGGVGGYWHGHTMIQDNDPNIKHINGKFLRVRTNYGGGWWEWLVAPAESDIRFETRNIPNDAINNPSGYNLKFEINTQKPIVSGTSIRMFIGNNMPSERNSTHFRWTPVLDTKGKWETITIPFEQIRGALPNWNLNPNGYGVSFWFWDGAAMDTDFAVDNFRVVPK
jgi:hypothetical protein